eukprot:COSAG01_NODE_1716_length_9403_cov_4.038697_3_plen_217_part_00
MKDCKHWNKFYKTNSKDLSLMYRSDFAYFCEKNFFNKCTHPLKILELGSGNGRDSFFFAQKGHQTLGIDSCETATFFCSAKHRQYSSLNFTTDDFTNLEEKKYAGFNVIYSRFTLHSIDLEGENRVLNFCRKVLNKNDLICIEARTTEDDLFLQGKKLIHKNERFTDHYRRHIDANDFLKKCCTMGFDVCFFVKSKGLAVYKKQDPVVMRIILKKK